MATVPSTEPESDMAKCSKFTSALLLLFCAFGSNLCDDPLDVLADLKPVDLSQGSPGKLEFYWCVRRSGVVISF